MPMEDKNLNTYFPEHFIALLDEMAEEIGTNRKEWVRTALVEKMIKQDEQFGRNPVKTLKKIKRS